MESFKLLINKRILLIILIFSLGNYASAFFTVKSFSVAFKLINIILFIVIYVHIVIDENANFAEVIRYSKKYFFRFAGITIYLIAIVALTMLIVIIFLKVLHLFDSYDDILKDSYFYPILALVLFITIPLYLYSPAIFITKDSYVYEAIIQGYKFFGTNILLSFFTWAMVFLCLFLKESVSFHNPYVDFAKQYAINVLFFYAINISAISLKSANLSFVSKKKKADQWLSNLSLKEKFLGKRGKIK